MAIAIQGGPGKMTLKDISNGPEWVLWAVFWLFLMISIVFISGHGDKLIAGYNTASKEEKSVNVNIKMIKKLKIIMYVFATLLQPASLSGTVHL